LINQILCSQNPETGMVLYYVPLNSGATKAGRFSTPFDSFWCCVDTGMENHARYGESIYGHDDQGVYVNLFIASELDWKEKGVKIRQETAFPENHSIKLILSCAKPTPLVVRIRRPVWAHSEAELILNGKKIPVPAVQAGYLSLDRTWNNGDTLEVRFPMTLSLEPMPDNPQRAAILYGPVVLAGLLGKRPPSAEEIPVLVTGGKSVDEWLKPIPGEKLEFQTENVGRPRDLTLAPFYQVYDQHYVVYWDLLTQEQWEKREAEYQAERKRQQELEARTIDFFAPGVEQNERAHGLQGEKSDHGDLGERRWRHAVDGGWFSFKLKILPDAPMELVVTYWGSDDGGRTFDLLLDGEKIATESLRREKPEKFFDRSYVLPERLTRGKSQVEVKFQAHPGKIAGGIFGARMLKSKP
jgi:hypothetical protein